MFVARNTYGNIEEVGARTKGRFQRNSLECCLQTAQSPQHFLSDPGCIRARQDLAHKPFAAVKSNLARFTNYTSFQKPKTNLQTSSSKLNGKEIKCLQEGEINLCKISPICANIYDLAEYSHIPTRPDGCAQPRTAPPLPLVSEALAVIGMREVSMLVSFWNCW